MEVIRANGEVHIYSVGDGCVWGWGGGGEGEGSGEGECGREEEEGAAREVEFGGGGGGVVVVVEWGRRECGGAAHDNGCMVEREERGEGLG